ncbi:RNA-binding protein 24-like [Mytilus galloprovincialis]|uniref:RRM domain-containing protein n=2 Tax=Mytilus galloprovincialis TaxID=29158 RepID=A0A8B6GYS7_MYTGA|nr:Hypothetical predicted protein [Mytilus galloprovincialis]
MSTSADISPCITPSTTPLSGTHAPKYGTVIPNRIFVGGIAANTTEDELKNFFCAYGAVKDSKIIADRAGVSKGYGFITFENQEDADRIIKNESENLVFRDRKLNIGPAIRKQVSLEQEAVIIPRAYDPTLPAGSVMYSNGIPYTYQNGLAIFQPPTEGGYPIPQPQVQSQAAAAAYSTLMLPQASPQAYYISPQYAYQPVTPQWATTNAQWRWAPQSPTQAMTGSPAYYYTTMQTASPEQLMYAHQQPQLTLPTGEVSDPGTALIDASSMEGSLVPVCPADLPRTYVSDVPVDQPVSTTVPVYPSSVCSSTLPSKSTTTVPSVAPYTKKTVTTIPRRTFSSPTILVKHGHKVQRVMMPAKPVANTGAIPLYRPVEMGAGDASDACAQYSYLATSPPPEFK